MGQIRTLWGQIGTSTGQIGTETGQIGTETGQIGTENGSDWGADTSTMSEEAWLLGRRWQLSTHTDRWHGSSLGPAVTSRDDHQVTSR